jgi:hypothetical protein
MKTALFLLVSSAMAFAQFPVPSGKGGTGTRTIDGGSSVSPGVAPARPNDEKITQHITQLSLSEMRSWTSSDGKVIEAKLIAFEDLRVESVNGAVVKQPEPPKYPTVVKDSSVRLAVNRKPVILPLTRLSKEDQEFVEKIRLQHAPKP